MYYYYYFRLFTCFGITLDASNQSERNSRNTVEWVTHFDEVTWPQKIDFLIEKFHTLQPQFETSYLLQ